MWKERDVLWSAGKRVRRKMHDVGGGADCRRICKKNSNNARFWGALRTLPRNLNGVRPE